MIYWWSAFLLAMKLFLFDITSIIPAINEMVSACNVWACGHSDFVFIAL